MALSFLPIASLLLHRATLPTAAQRPKIRRLRASEDTFKTNVTPQAKPISKNGRVAIRLIVGRHSFDGT